MGTQDEREVRPSRALWGISFPLISDHGEPLWILEQRKTVFNEDNSSSCVEDGGKEGRQDTSQTLPYAVAMEMEMRMEGNNAEEELAATGVDWRGGAGFWSHGQREPAPGQCAISNNEHGGKG